MLKFTKLASAVAIVLVAGIAPSLASDDVSCGYAPRASWISSEAATAKLTELGYDVRRLKAEDNCLEAYAIDKTGRRVEVYLNPVSGEIVRVKNKS